MFFRRKDPVRKKLEEIAEFLKKHRYKIEFNPTITKCREHEGLTYRCIGDGKLCVTCLGCEVEAVLKDPEFPSCACGRLVFIGDEFRAITEEEYRFIPKLSEENKHKFINMLNELRDLLMKERTDRLSYFKSLLEA